MGYGVASEKEKKKISAILSEKDVLRFQRTAWDGLCEKTNGLFSHFAREFYEGSQGETTFVNRNTHLLDDKMVLFANRFSLNVSGKSFPSDHQWFGLKAVDPAVGDVLENRGWIEGLEKALAFIISSPNSNFQNSIDMVCHNLGLYGAGAMIVEMGYDGMPKFLSLPIEQCYYNIDQNGMPDVFVRRVAMTWREAKIQYGDILNTLLPADTVKANNTNELKLKVHIVHHIKRDLDYHPRKLGTFPYKSTTIIEEGNRILLEEGYYHFPIALARWKVEQYSQYPSSPAMSALAAAAQANSIIYDLMAIWQYNAHPALVVGSQGAVGGNIEDLVSSPGQVINVPSSQGNLKNDLFFLPNPSDTSGMTEALESVRDVVFKLFFLDLFDTIPPPQSQRGAQSHMTATEVERRYQASLSQLSPIIKGGINQQFKGSLVMRLINIVAKYGLIPPPPDERLLSYEGLEITYRSYMEVVMGANATESIQSYLQRLGSFINLAPDLTEEIMSPINLPKASKLIAKYEQVPTEILRTDEEMQQIKEANQQKKAGLEQQQLGLAQSQEVKNIAEAEAKLTGARNEQLQ